MTDTRSEEGEYPLWSSTDERRKGIQEYLSVDQQAALAERIAALAKEHDSELSGEFIRNHIIGVLHGVKSFARMLTEQQIKEMEQSDARYKFGNQQHHFARNIVAAWGDREQMLKLMGKHRDMRFVITPEFRRALDIAQEIVQKLKGRV